MSKLATDVLIVAVNNEHNSKNPSFITFTANTLKYSNIFSSHLYLSLMCEKRGARAQRCK